MSLILPAWQNELWTSPEERATYLARFVVRSAALHASREGTLSYLSEAIGYRRNSLTTILSRDSTHLPLPVAVGIERLLGPELFPRALLRPDVFA